MTEKYTSFMEARKVLGAALNKALSSAVGATVSNYVRTLEANDNPDALRELDIQKVVSELYELNIEGPSSALVTEYAQAIAILYEAELELNKHLLPQGINAHLGRG